MLIAAMFWVYGWFTEGFDALDLKEAKALLEELHACVLTLTWPAGFLAVYVVEGRSRPMRLAPASLQVRNDLKPDLANKVIRRSTD